MNKLLSRDEATFEELTPSEQKLWNSFETDQIYRLLTGEAARSRFQESRLADMWY